MKQSIRATLLLITAALALALLAAGAFRLLPKDFQGRRLFGALRGGHTTQARLLVWLGTDPNFQTGSGSAMHYAAATGDVALMQFLFNHGAIVDSAVKFGVTPLYEARRNHQPEAERFLLAHGANPDTSHIKVP